MPLRVQKKLMKSTWYPQPHRSNISFSFECDDETINSTIVPLIHYDEALGDPTALETNPRNAAFGAPAQQSNCFVDSRINNIFAELKFNLTSFAADDNIQALRFATMPIYMSFKENYTAIDELSSTEVQDVLNLQTEDTDRQGGPLFVAATDLLEKFSASATLHTTAPFLDTDTGLEAVAFNPVAFYNALQFMTIGPLLAKSTGGLSWDTLTPNRPFIRKRFHIVPKVKRMNEFTFAGILIHFPVLATADSLQAAGEITAAKAMAHVTCNIRFNEWNENFNSRML